MLRPTGLSLTAVRGRCRHRHVECLAACPGAHRRRGRARGITKRFPGVVANDDVNIAVRRGHVHAIVGENGAGKSTLMKILYGMQRPDEGTIAVDGRDVAFHSPSDAIDTGIGMVHQHFMLADNLTVLENVVLGSEPTRAGFIDFAAAKRRIKEIADAYGLDVEPDELVEDLGVGDRQRVEILKVLYRGARILILDEPTAVLVPQEVDELFDNLRELKDEGLTILFISHKLDEVLQVADEITVIRRGTTVDTVDPASVTARQLAELMVGSELPTPETRESTVTDEPVLEVEGLSIRPAGERPAARGHRLHDPPRRGPGHRRRRGQRPGRAGRGDHGDAPDDRRARPARRHRHVGLVDPVPPRGRHRLHPRGPAAPRHAAGRAAVGEPHPRPPDPEAQRQGALDRPGRRAQGHRADRPATTTSARPGIDVLAASLSGGNQQKLIVGREMSGEPKVLIAAHPTRGVDVGAQAAIWEHIRAARRAGLAVLLISADLDELIGLSDSLKVILRGRFVADVDPATSRPRTSAPP